MRMRTLKLKNKLTAQDLAEVEQLLGESDMAGYFDDNGGDPDGNAWLPSQPLDETDPGVQNVLDAALGEMVDAAYTDMTAVLLANWDDANDGGPLAEATLDDQLATLDAILSNCTYGWAAYGNGDVVVYVPDEA